MSVLIKGFVMPTKREECPFCDYEEGSCLAWLNVKDDDKTRYCIQGVHPPKDRPKWCPLVEIPNHGDLIDREALMPKGEGKGLRLMAIGIENIVNAPTVIPAERSKASPCDICDEQKENCSWCKMVERSEE